MQQGSIVCFAPGRFSTCAILKQITRILCGPTSTPATSDHEAMLRAIPELGNNKPVHACRVGRCSYAMCMSLTTILSSTTTQTTNNDKTTHASPLSNDLDSMLSFPRLRMPWEECVLLIMGAALRSQFMQRLPDNTTNTEHQNILGHIGFRNLLHP